MKKLSIIRFTYLFLVLLGMMVSLKLNADSKTNIDSLKNELESVAGKEKLELIKKIAFHYVQYEPDPILAIEWSQRLIDEAGVLEENEFVARGQYYIAVTQTNSGNYQLAIQKHNEVRSYYEDSKNDFMLAATYKELGRNYFLLGMYDSAMTKYKMANKIGELLNNDSILTVTQNSIHFVERKLGNYQKALSALQKALIHAEKVNDENQIGNLYNGFAIVHYYIGNKDKSIVYFKKSLAIKEKSDDPFGTATLKSNLAKIYIEQNRHEEALEILLGALSIYRNIQSKAGESSALQTIGSLYIQLNKLNDALKYLQESLEIASLIDRKATMAANYNLIADVHIKKGNFKMAQTNAEQALRIYEEIGEVEGILLSYRKHASIAESIENYKVALEFNKLHKELSDSILNESKLKQIQELEAKYDNEKVRSELKSKELENARLVLEVSRQRNYLFGAGVLFLTLFLFVVLYFGARKKRYDKQLGELRVLKDEAIAASLNQSKGQEQEPEILQETRTSELTSIAVTVGHKIIFIPIGEVKYFKAEDKYVFLHDKKGEQYIVDYTLSKLEGKLPGHFIRIHRTYIINSQQIKELSKGFKGRYVITLKGEKEERITSTKSFEENILRLIDITAQ